jgi:uncharacterized protein
MRFGHIVVFLVFAIVNIVPGHTQTMNRLGILTGAKNSTYFEFGEDISNIIGSVCGAKMEVYDTIGSLDNLKKLRKQPFVQLALVQHDVLSFIKVFRQDDKELQDWVDKYRYVFSLYPEEVHILTRKNSGIDSIEQLNGKRVAIGLPNSGTHLTATMLLNLVGVTIYPVELTPEAAIDKLAAATGDKAELDAAFYVVGKPTPYLDQRGPKYANLKLVTVNNKNALTLYQPAQIGPADYPWVSAPVQTVAVNSALISFDFKEEQCHNVAMVARQILENFEELKRIGHKKWAEVNLQAPVAGWPRYDCVTDRLNVPIKVSADASRKKCEFGSSAPAQPVAECNCDRFTGAEKIICSLSQNRGVCPK